MSNHTTDLTNRQATGREIFDDPVPYLAALGLDTEVVDEGVPVLPLAA